MRLAQLVSFTFVLLTGLSQATTVQRRSDGDVRVHYNPRIQVPPSLQDPSRRSNVDLFERQSTCGAGQVACSDGGCCRGSCCGNGCCPLLYTCSIIDNIPGCCPVGRICGSDLGGCTSSNLVPCANYDHCCPRGETCYLDNGRAACSDGGNDNGGYTETVASTTPSRSTDFATITSSTLDLESSTPDLESSTPDLETSGGGPRMSMTGASISILLSVSGVFLMF